MQWPEWEAAPLPLLESLEYYPVTFNLSSGTKRDASAAPLPGALAAPLLDPQLLASVKTLLLAQENVAVESAQIGKPVALITTAEGTPPLRYQWTKDGQAVPNGTGALLSLAKVKATDAGVYLCIVWNDAGSQLSPPIRLIVK